MSIFQDKKNRGRQMMVLVCVVLLVVLGMWPNGTEAQTTTRVSVATGGVQGNFESAVPTISANGRFIVFESGATNLVPGDTNGTTDMFVHDRQTGETTRVSVATGGLQGNRESGEEPAISADGRFVAFASGATNLVPNDTNGHWDAFVHDRQTGITTRVSGATGGGQGNGSFGEDPDPALSGDGRLVAFDSGFTNLVVGDTNFSDDIFVHDRQTGITTRVSVATGGGQANGGSENSTISADGRFVAFASGASNLVPGDTNGAADIFVHDRQTGTTTRVSVATGGGQGFTGGVGGCGFDSGFEGSEGPHLSADGRFVAFESQATNLVTGDTNNVADTFVHDRQTGITTRVNVATGGGQGNGSSCDIQAALSADGRFVSFASEATNLVPGDTNGVADGFVHDRQTGITTRVSVATGGGQANEGIGEGEVVMSEDGLILKFSKLKSDNGRVQRGVCYPTR